MIGFSFKFISNRVRVARLCFTVVLASVFPSWLFALPTGFQSETLVIGLAKPVYLQQLPDGRFLVMKKNGAIDIFDPTIASPIQASQYLQLFSVEIGGERGLTSMAIDPDFEQNGYLYIYYSHQASGKMRISRFTHTGNSADSASELMIWQDSDNWPNGSGYHYGGGLGFGPDGKLYLTIGDQGQSTDAQQLDHARGKIIRINKDGSIPADNPYVDGPGGALDEIWAIGLRNPYRAHWDLQDDRLYIGEVGTNNPATSREDIHVGRHGANFGWPDCEGQCANPAYDDPIYDYPHAMSGNLGGAVTVGFVYRYDQIPSAHSHFPPAYDGVLFFADYNSGWIKYLTFNPDGTVVAANDFADNLGAPVHLVQGQDRALYYVDYQGGKVGRIRYDSGNDVPIIQSATVDVTTGQQPLFANFSAVAMDANNDPLTYTWHFGDGEQAGGAQVSHTYAANGVYDAYVVVSDGEAQIASDPLTMQVGSAPAVTIDMPLNGAAFRAGDWIDFSATVFDPDETVPAANYKWEVVFLHNTHTHPFISEYIGASGQFFIDTSGHDYQSNTSYDVRLEVTDSDGLVGSDNVIVVPDKVDLSFSTQPAGIPVYIDGIPNETPFSYDTLIGFNHVIAVPLSQCVAGTWYFFDNWSDGGLATHSINVPNSNAGFTANYTTGGLCAESDGLVLRLEADIGVTTANGVVTGWADQSGLGNDLAGSGDPTRVAQAPSGALVIDLDGVGDKLESLGLTGLPTGNADRTVYLVSNYRSIGNGGFSYGAASCNNAFGTIVDSSGELMVQGWCSSNDYGTAEPGSGEGWLIQSARLDGGQLDHFIGDQLIDQKNHAFNTVLQKMVLGADLDDDPKVSMQVGAVLIYDRALSVTEHTQVLAYLEQKYFTGGGFNVPPVAVNDNGTVVNGASVSLSVLDNDSDDGGLDFASLEIDSAPLNGEVVANPDGTILYTHDGGATSSDSFTYRVYDLEGAVSNSAIVYLSVTGSGGNNPPLANADSASVLRGAVVTIPVLSNDTDDSNLDVGTVEIVTQAVYGVANPNPQTGEVVYFHGGVSSAPDSFEYRVMDDMGEWSNPALVTITVLLPDAGVVLLSPTEGGQVNGPQITVRYGLQGDDYNHLHLTLNGQGHNTIRDLTGNFTFTGVVDGQHTISAQLVDAGHNPITVPSAFDSVSFTVSNGAISEPGLLIRLGLDEGSGSLAVDDSGMGNNGSLQGSPSYISNTPDGSAHAVRLDGVSDYIDIGTLDVAGTGLSLAAFFNADAFPGSSRDPRIVSKASGTSANEHTYMLSTIKVGTDTRLRARLNTDGTTKTLIASSGNLSTGVWHHGAATYDGNTLRLYLDGLQVGSMPVTGTISVDPAIRVAVGSQPGGVARWFDGSLDDVRILDRAMSPAEIFDLATGNTPPVANHDFMEVIKNTVLNASVLENDVLVDNATISEFDAVTTLGGTVTDGGNGVLIYTPPPDVEGFDSFTYTITDDQSESSTATVIIAVTSVVIGC